jgi:hypothetical protein
LTRGLPLLLIAVLHPGSLVAGERAGAPQEDTAARAFLADLQRLVLRDDRRAVAGLIRYPILVASGTVQIPFADAAALVERYDLVFSPALKSKIAQSAFATPGQRQPTYAAVASSGALTFAGGAILAEQIDGVFRITRISLAMDDQFAAVAGEASARGTAGSRGRRAPERLTVRGRLHMAQASGTLAAGETRSYVVWGGQGQLFEARVDGVRGREILLRVVNAKTGAPIDARAAEGVRRWMGRLTAGADYRIDLLRGAPSSEQAPRYVLVVSVK